MYLTTVGQWFRISEQECPTFLDKYLGGGQSARVRGGGRAGGQGRGGRNFGARDYRREAGRGASYGGPSPYGGTPSYGGGGRGYGGGSAPYPPRGGNFADNSAW